MLEEKPDNRAVAQSMRANDWHSVNAIYLEGLATGQATFQTEPVTWQEWDGSHLRACRLVLRTENEIRGWAALSPISKRHVYHGVAEVSVYIAAGARGRGLGKHLLAALIEESERVGIWTLQASIFPENLASIALHQRCDFRLVGRREKLGKLRGTWRDVLLFERRSSVAGTT